MVFPLPKRLRVLRLLAGPFILLAVGVGYFSGGLSLTVVLLFVAALPGMYSVEVPYSREAGLHWLRAGLLLVSTTAITLILWSRYSSLPTWLVIVGAIYALLGLPAAAFDLALAMNPQLRQRLLERRLQRDWPTSGT
jgi:hypothetical protein